MLVLKFCEEQKVRARFRSWWPRAGSLPRPPGQAILSYYLMDVREDLGAMILGFSSRVADERPDGRSPVPHGFVPSLPIAPWEGSAG